LIFQLLSVFFTGKIAQLHRLRSSLTNVDYGSWDTNQGGEGANDAVIKGMSAKDISDFYTSVGNTRTVVATDCITYKMGVGASPAFVSHECRVWFVRHETWPRRTYLS
jgi:hypothetical protein